MNKILALGLPALLCLAMAAALQCNGCFMMLQDGSCMLGKHTCTAARGESCFTRKITIAGFINRVERGCTSICEDTEITEDYYKDTTQCCTDADFCNIHNPFPKFSDYA
ncbi:prostate stem cell antigen-like [Mauremys reevesii]|uniref:prostate stem cell antigen-like n=1 Tax=Mauremys reevesii TaxID=260615 RepID=UPI0019401999|nr:prostate stem cell antigen-like [Mauremys reevesii]